ncbi:kynurenine formamidase isoform X3 [Chelonia mydas]|uniref:kynurenine formamidase isoform X3 n=1 Tax=Chelonia mydas TaxID=8469 RepID=UPI0018A1E7F9|nr:kynurenine formamidase isoform X3 [Chelonia mydas]
MARNDKGGTRRAQATMQTLLHVPYGGSDGEKLDIYLPTDLSEAFPLVLYIHGGYWQFLSKEVSGFIAPPLVTQGIAVVAVGYDLAPKGHLDAMVAQVRRSVAFLVQQYSKISGVYLCGHSAGAHLAAMVLSTDWEEYGVTPDIKGAFLVSGVYDLEPITHTSVNNLLHMSREVARRNSPILCVTAAKPARKACEVLIAVAQHDSPEFHRQSQEYFQVLLPAAPPSLPFHARVCASSGMRGEVSGRTPAQPCAQLAGESLCWTLLTQITLTSLRSYTRGAIS